MVAYHTVQQAVTALVTSRSLVAVVIGGTSGIGMNTVKALAKAHGTQGKGLRVYIVGRNETSAAETIAQCVRVCPSGEFRFVKCADMALLKDADALCDEVIRQETEEVRRLDKGATPKVDLLCCSQALFGWPPRNETSEGLDRAMSLIYYSRMRCITNFLPLLLASDLPAHVVSVFGAGLEGTMKLDDLSLRKEGNWAFLTVRAHVVAMTTMYLECLAERYPGKLSLSHTFPGLVMTTAFQSPLVPSWFKVLWKIFTPLLRFMAYTDDENGYRMLYLGTSYYPPADGANVRSTGAGPEVAVGSDLKAGSGAYAVVANSEPVDAAKMEKNYDSLRQAGFKERVWEHTNKAFTEIAAGRRFVE